MQRLYRMLVFGVLLIVSSLPTDAKEAPLGVSHIRFPLPESLKCYDSSVLVTADSAWVVNQPCLSFLISEPIYSMSASLNSHSAHMVHPDLVEFVLDPTASQIFYADGPQIFRQSLVNGAPILVTTAYTLPAPPLQTRAPEMPCAATAAPAAANAFSEFVDDMTINAEGTYLYYTSFAYETEDCGGVWPSFDIHSVDLATGADLVINRPYFYTDRDPFNDYCPLLIASDGFILANRVRIAPDGSGGIAAEYQHNCIDQTRLLPQRNLVLNIDIRSTISPPSWHALLTAYDVASNTVTTLADIALPDIRQTYWLQTISPDERWVVFAIGDTFYRLDLTTNDLITVPLPENDEHQALAVNATDILYTLDGNLLRYNVADTQSHMLFDATDPEHEFRYVPNHAGDAVLIEKIVPDIFFPCVIDYFYLPLDTGVITPLYHPEDLCDFNNAIFSPNDEFLVYTGSHDLQQLYTGPDNSQLSVYAIFLHEQRRNWSIYTPILMR